MGWDDAAAMTALTDLAKSAQAAGHQTPRHRTSARPRPLSAQVSERMWARDAADARR